MFREMRRNKQALSAEESIGVLERALSGVLAVTGDEDYPYAVPLSFVYDACGGNGKIYFHCAMAGHKIDAIHRSSKVSFCVVDQDKIVPEEYTTYFRSVIVFGKIRVLEEEAEKLAAAKKLAVKYAPNDSESNREHTIREASTRLCMLELQIEHMTGKEAKELKLGK